MAEKKPGARGMDVVSLRHFINRSIRVFFLFILFLLTLSSCADLPDELDFPSIVTEDATFHTGIGVVFLRAFIRDRTTSDITRTGFFWSDTLVNVESLQNVHDVHAYGGGIYTTVAWYMSKMEIHKPIYYRAYAIFDNPAAAGTRVSIGDIKEFNFNIQLSVPSLLTRSNNQVKLETHFSGLGPTHILFRHGYVYSSQNTIPTDGQTNTVTIDLGELNFGENFEDAVATNLSVQTYYYRSFISSMDTTYYSTNIGQF